MNHCMVFVLIIYYYTYIVHGWEELGEIMGGGGNCTRDKSIDISHLLFFLIIISYRGANILSNVAIFFNLKNSFYIAVQS